MKNYFIIGWPQKVLTFRIMYLSARKLKFSGLDINCLFSHTWNPLIKSSPHIGRAFCCPRWNTFCSPRPRLRFGPGSSCAYWVGASPWFAPLFFSPFISTVMFHDIGEMLIKLKMKHFLRSRRKENIFQNLHLWTDLTFKELFLSPRATLRQNAIKIHREFLVKSCVQRHK